MCSTASDNLAVKQKPEVQHLIFASEKIYTEEKIYIQKVPLFPFHFIDTYIKQKILIFLN